MQPAVPYPRALAAFPRLRQSTLAVFDACPLNASWVMEHEQDWSSFPAAAGQIVHRTCARSLRKMIANRERQVPVEVALQEFEHVLRQSEVPMLSEGRAEDSVAPLPLRWIAEARTCVITWALGSEWDIENFAGVERRLEAVVPYPVAPDGDPAAGMVERTVTGRPDCILIERNGWHAIVPDFKTGWALPPERGQDPDALADGADPEDEPISEEGYFQQRFYALVIFATFPGIQRVTLREVYVRYMTSTSQKPTREASIHRSKLPELMAEFSQLVERFDRSFEEGVWKPSPGSHCWNCVQGEKCPILPSARREGRVTSQEEALQVAEFLGVTEALTRRFREALRPWTDKHGPVPIKDAKRPRVYGPVIRSVTSRPSADEVRWAMENGIDPASLYRTREVTKFEAYNERDVPRMVHDAAVAEAMLAAAQKRSAAARKGAKTRAARRKNGGGS